MSFKGTISRGIKIKAQLPGDTEAKIYNVKKIYQGTNSGYKEVIHTYRKKGTSAKEVYTAYPNLYVVNKVITGWRRDNNSAVDPEVIVIPDTVDITSVDSHAFENCNVREIIFEGSNVTNIGSYAFAYCANLQHIQLPSNLQELNQYTFLYCNSLTSITIPKSVTYISFETFDSCNALDTIVVESGNTKYDSRNNCNAVIETATNKLVCGCKGTVIPNTVVTIGSRAFDDIATLTSISIPSSVKTIQWEAFRKCTGLQSVIFDSNSQLQTIESSAFMECSSLYSITLPNSLITLSSNTFTSCTSLTSVYIPTSVQTIQSPVFNYCPALTSITIPYIGDVRKNSADSKTVLGYLFDNDTSASFDSNLYVKIRQYYSNSTSIEYTFPKSLRSVTILENVILYGAFYGCSMLTQVNLANSTTTIPIRAFYECSNITDMTWPTSLSYIEEEAFFKCNFTTITLPQTLLHIKRYAFGGNLNLRYLEIPFVGENGSTVASIAGCFTYIVDSRSNINNSCTYIAAYGNHGAYVSNSINEVVVKYNNGRPLSAYSFYNCSTLKYITIQNITTIDANAFSNCTSLEYLEIGEDTTYIGSGILSKCPSITDITIPFVGSSRSPGSSASNTEKWFGWIFGSTSFTPSLAITTPDGGTKYFPDTAITVTINSGSSYADLRSGAFKNCYNVDDIRLEGSINLYDNCLDTWANNSDYSYMVYVTPSNSLSIPYYMCKNCSELSGIILGAQVTDIKNYALYNCTNLRSIDIRRTSSVITLASSTSLPTKASLSNPPITVQVPKGMATTYKNTSIWSTLQNNETVNITEPK